MILILNKRPAVTPAAAMLHAPRPVESAPAPVPLSQLPVAASARVVSVAVDDDDAIRLKSLGLCTGRKVRILRPGDPLVVQVLGGRIGIAARLAERVFVRLD